MSTSLLWHIPMAAGELVQRLLAKNLDGTWSMGTARTSDPRAPMAIVQDWIPLTDYLMEGFVQFSVRILLSPNSQILEALFSGTNRDRYLNRHITSTLKALGIPACEIQTVLHESMATEQVSWAHRTTIAVGGLIDIGFTSDDRYILIVSSAGRGLIDTSTGSRCARCYEEPTVGRDWWRESGRQVVAIGPRSNETVPVFGVSGATMSTSTSDGWSVVAHDGPAATTRLLLLPPQESMSALALLLPESATELIAMGFSRNGDLLAVAYSSDLTVYYRNPGSNPRP